MCLLAQVATSLTPLKNNLQMRAEEFEQNNLLSECSKSLSVMSSLTSVTGAS